MSIIGNCQPCPGGANPVILVNPDPNVNVVVVTGNTVFIPQRLDPDQICFNGLGNIDLLNVSTLPQGLGAGQVLPLAWDGDACCVVPWLPPCPQVLAYDPGAAPDPGPVDLTAYPVGTTVFYALNQVSGCIDQLWDCAAATWRGFCGSAPVVGPTADQVCYDVTSWGAPAWDFDNIGGLWSVLGVNRVTESCPAGAPVTVFADTPNTEFSIEYPSTGGAGPPAGWGTLTTWNPVATVDGTAAGFIGYTPGSIGGADRIAVRSNFGVAPSTRTGPVRYQLDFVDVAGGGVSGAIRYAALDTISNTLQPIIANAGAGVVSAGPGGQHVYAIGLAAGDSIDFTVALNPSVDPANVYLLVWNLGGVDMDEVHNNIRATLQPTANNCCESWSGVADLTSYLNSHDPNGGGWSIDPDGLGNPNLVCRLVALGAGSQYSTLNGCTTPAIVPTVTQV